ncbi:MAG: rhomboid family intramembrane serine protease [Planctomycetota bacterium]|jgi:membrane associated rhomboid family serine protease
MILPIRTNIRPWRTPYANYTIIIINVIVFLFTFAAKYDPRTQELLSVLRPWADNFKLKPLDLEIWQFITYAFLHGGFFHIGFNMYFLYLFGNNVNDKLGHTNYVFFYLAGAILSGAGHIAFTKWFVSGPFFGIPLIGASGAVAAVTGAYLVLYPQTLITIIYWFFFIGTIELPALYFIAFKMILIDNIIVAQAPEVAYEAHLAGYAFGISSLLILLSTGIISGTGLDLYAMLKQWNRRRRYRDVVSSGYDPYTGTGSKKIRAKEINKSPLNKEQEEKVLQLRSEIAQRIAQHNLPAAAQAYLDLIDIDYKQIIPRQYLLDVANQLASESRYTAAANAYEQFLIHYKKYEHAEQIQLMLGIIYSRYLHNQELAIKHLEDAKKKLTNPDQIQMAKDELEKLQN